MLKTRWIIRRDVESSEGTGDVVALEAKIKEFWGWTAHQFVEALREQKAVGLVVFDDENDRVFGFIVYHLESSEIKIVNIAALNGEAYKVLFDCLKSKLNTAKRHTIFMEVYEADLELLNCFKKNDFLCVDIMKNHFKEFNHDAFKMQYSVKKAENKGKDKDGEGEYALV